MSVKRVRPRTGYVMVEFSPEERASLESVCEHLSDQTSVRFSLSSTLRHLAKEAAKKISRKSRSGS